MSALHSHRCRRGRSWLKVGHRCIGLGWYLNLVAPRKPGYWTQATDTEPVAWSIP